MSRASNVYKLLGLARRAGAVVPGTAAARDSVRSGEARLVLLAGDASPAQLDKVRRILEHRPVPRAIVGDRAALGAAVGLESVSVVAVTSASFADRMLVEVGEAARPEGALAAAVEAAEE